MNSEEQFKRSLNDKLDAKEFVFDQHNWEKARQLIDASKNKRRRLLYIFFTGVLLISGFLTTAYLLRQTAQVVDKEMDIAQPANVLKKENTITPPSSEKSGDRLTTPTPAPQTKPLSAPVIPAGKVGSLASPQIIVQNTVQTAPAPSIKEEPKQVAASGSDTHGNAGTPSEPELAAHEEPVVIPAPSVDKSTVTNESPAPAFIPAVITSGSVSPSETNEAVVSSNIVAPAAPLVAQGALVEEKKEEASIILPATEEMTTAVISASVAVAKPDTDYVRRKKPVLLFEAGANYHLGWKNDENTEANGFSPAIGLNILSPINSSMAVGIGMQYSSVRNLNFSSYTSKITTLDLGEESEVTVYTPSTLHYLMVPIRLYYKMNALNVFGGGVNAGYLMAVTSKVESYTQTFAGISNIENSKSNSYNQGFVSFDLQLSAFYMRSLGRHFHAKAELFYGFKPVKDQDFFPSGSGSGNKGVKLTILYDIFKNF